MNNRFLIWMSLNGTLLARLIVIGILAVVFALAIKPNKIEPVAEDAIEIPTVTLPATYLGEFSISHYCSCPICTGTANGSKTATGHIPREGRTVAVDKNLIPLHSVIYVEGLGTFVAEDVGGAIKGKHLDIYIDDHERALNLGTLGGCKKKVYVLQ